ncbi:hypothetical protein GYMLUDRAFT_774905, partial [Collybiopsis luxurians FD-317 M1]
MWLGICKKCCLLCWLLVKSHEELISVSAGSHSRSFRWVPPEGLSSDVIKTLLSLLNVQPTLKGSHLQQSSGVSSEVILSKPALPPDAYSADLSQALWELSASTDWNA